MFEDMVGGARDAAPRGSRGSASVVVTALSWVGRKARGGIRSWWRRAELERELATLTDQEIEDAGFVRSEIPTVLKNYPASSDLRQRMMRRLGIDSEAAWRRFPGLMRAIHRACALCGARKACERWLDSEEPGRGHHLFCPNADDLDTIKDRHERDIVASLAARANDLDTIQERQAREGTRPPAGA